MIANMHLHSRFSDGTLWPEESAREAALAGLDFAVLTDHDTMAGVMRFIEACEARGIRAIPACEIDIEESEIDYKSELLAYFPYAAVQEGSSIERVAPATAALLAQSLVQRRQRLLFLLASAQELFPATPLSFEELFRDKTGLAFDEQLAQAISWSKVDLFLYLKAKHCINAEMNYKAFRKNSLVAGFSKIQDCKAKCGSGGRGSAS